MKMKGGEELFLLGEEIKNLGSGGSGEVNQYLRSSTNRILLNSWGADWGVRFAFLDLGSVFID